MPPVGMNPGLGLGGGFLASSSGAIYTPLQGQSTVVNELFIRNTGVASETCVFTTTSGLSLSAVLAAGEQASIFDNENTLSMAPGDILSGSATNASVVAYKVGGSRT